MRSNYQQNENRINSMVTEASASYNEGGIAEKRLDTSDLKKELKHILRGDIKNDKDEWISPTEVLDQEIERVEKLKEQMGTVNDETIENIYNSIEKRYENLENSRIVNEYGIQRIMSLFEGGKNIMLSNFEDQQLENDIIFFHKFLANYLGTNYQKFGINKTDIPMLITLVVDYKKALIYRARKGGESDAISKRAERIEKIGQDLKNKGKSILPFK